MGGCLNKVQQSRSEENIQSSRRKRIANVILEYAVEFSIRAILIDVLTQTFFSAVIS